MQLDQIPALTTRDELALKAMQGMLTRPGNINIPNLVNTAYQIADAVIQRMKDDAP